MIDVTRCAAIEIRSLLTHSKHSRASAGHVLRLTFDGKSGIAMGLGEPAGDDVVIGDVDGPVLAIAPQLARRLDGLVFDWIISEMQGLDGWMRSLTSSSCRARRQRPRTAA